MLRAFPMSLTKAASCWLRHKPSGLITTLEDLKTKTRSTKTSDGLAAIQAQLNNLGREIKKVNEKVYAAQVRCEQCKGPHYTKDFPLKEEGKTLEEAYYTQFGAPFQGGGYRATAPGFYQRSIANPPYQERRQSMEKTLSKFMGESAKRHEENSNLIKEIRASTNAAIRNQGASIKTLEIQVGQMSKVLQERGFGSLPSSTKTNPRDHVKSISTTIKVDASSIRRIGSHQYAEKDPRSFTLPCYINNFCFDNALADLGAIDREISKRIAENVLVEIGKFVFPVDFIILDMSEDIKVPLILGRPFLSTAHAKIDVFKMKITLRVGEEKIIFKSVKPAGSLIKRVYMLSLRERMELDLEASLIKRVYMLSLRERMELDLEARHLEARLIGETLVLNRSLDPLFGDYIELNDLNVPLELMRDQVDDLMPTI
ncbi:DNA-directed DNA polymerase [Tanacetum coccineum]